MTKADLVEKIAAKANLTKTTPDAGGVADVNLR